MAVGCVAPEVRTRDRGGAAGSRGDSLRHVGPLSEGGDSLWWSVEGRNKKSITLDLRQPEGQRILKELVRNADVFVENFRPGTLDRWNLSWSDLEQVNPRLIMLSVLPTVRRTRTLT